jgi:hypothetical protein
MVPKMAKKKPVSTNMSTSRVVEDSRVATTNCK